MLTTCEFCSIHNGMHFDRIHFNDTTTNNVSQLLNLSLAKYKLSMKKSV